MRTQPDHVAEIRRHLETICGINGQPKPGELMDALTYLDSLDPDSLSPQLRHYIEGRSYEKALNEL
ncbi:MAG: hypothetical protein ACFCU4_00720 [Puniceicoccaceae bacterium]